MPIDESRLSAYIKSARLKFEDRARDDILNVFQNFSALRCECRKHKFPDGIERTSLCLYGTIPVNYKNKDYNIPIALYLLDNHPYSGPYCYVCPTKNMSIRVSKYVDAAGRIYLPYLTEWNYPKYDTVGLLQVMTILFQEKAPLYTSVPAATPSLPTIGQPPVTRPQSTYQPPYPQAAPTTAPYPTGPVGIPQPFSTPQPNQPPYPTSSGYQAPYQPYVTMPSPLSVPANLDQSASNLTSSTHSLNKNSSNFSSYNTIQPSHIRASLTSAIDDRLRQRLKELMGTPYAELQSIDINLQELRTGNQKLREMIDNMEKEHKRIENLKTVYKSKRDELRKVHNDSKTSQTGDSNDAIDSVIEATTPLHRQIVHCYVQDCAIDDTIYSLGQALKRESINLETYIKYVRELSRKQFIHRATMQKARQLARLPV